MPLTYPETLVSIGDHIRKRRMELKLLQKNVAKICGVTDDCITNWEKNRSIPQIQFSPYIISFLRYLPFEVDLTTFAGKLKAYRYINGLSQKQLGKILRVDGATVGSWELGFAGGMILLSERSLNEIQHMDISGHCFRNR